MLPSSFGRRLLAALADSTPAFQAAPSRREQPTFERRILSALADTTPAFFQSSDHGPSSLQDINLTSTRVPSAIAEFADTLRTHSGAERLFSRHWLTPKFLTDLENLTSCSLLIKQIAFELSWQSTTTGNGPLVQQANELLTRLNKYSENHLHVAMIDAARYLRTSLAAALPDRRFAQIRLSASRALGDSIDKLLGLSLNDGLDDSGFMARYQQTTPHLAATKHIALFTYWSYSLRIDLATLRSMISNRELLRDSEATLHAQIEDGPFVLALQLATRRIAESILDMSGVDLGHEDLEGIDLTGIRWSRSTIWPAELAMEVELRSVEIQPGLFEIRDGVGMREEVGRDL